MTVIVIIGIGRTAADTCARGGNGQSLTTAALSTNDVTFALEQLPLNELQLRLPPRETFFGAAWTPPEPSALRAPLAALPRPPTTAVKREPRRNPRFASRKSTHALEAA